MKYEVSYIKRTRIMTEVEADSKQDAFYKVDYMAHTDHSSSDYDSAILGPTKVKVKEVK